MQVTRLTDFIYAFRLLYLIQKPWVEQEAYKFGIIDAKGERLRRWSELKTAEEKNSYTYFHRLAFNLKRMLEKVPGFENRFMQIGAAMRLLKEDETLGRRFTIEEIQFIGQRLVEDTPTNVTGDAVSTTIEKPIKGAMVKRKDAEKVNEIFDPMSAVILGLGALAAFPIAKKVAEILEPIIDSLKKNNGDTKNKSDIMKKIAVARTLANSASGEEKTKLLELIKKLEKSL